MIFTDEGILIQKTKYGETSLILKFLTKEHGITSGLCKGALRKKNISAMQLGNICQVEKRSREENLLGNISVELQRSSLFLTLNNNLAALILKSICDLVSVSFLQNQTPSSVYNLTKSIIILLKEQSSLCYYLLWEVFLLEKLGYAMDLSQCALTGEKTNLHYISPNTGKAATKTAGEIYKDKLLIIPSCYKEIPDEHDLSNKEYLEDMYKAIQVNSHFYEKFFKIHGIKTPESRNQIISWIKNKI